MKKYIIIAGVNGAGKTTLYSLFHSWSRIEKVNLDEIVRNNGDWRNPKDVIKAGKKAVQMMNVFFDKGISFCQETTLCGNSIIKNIDRAKRLGYEVEVHYVGVDSVEVAKERVAHRVLVGGHGIPEYDIERRYTESFEKLYLVVNICNMVILYDNTSEIRRFAIYKNGSLMRCSDIVPNWYERHKIARKYKVDYILQFGNVKVLIETKSLTQYRNYLERCGLYYDQTFDWERWQECEIMHGSQCVASIRRNGECEIYEPELMPYNLYLETKVSDDIDLRVQNIENFYHWCSSRLLPHNRVFSKEIWNSLGMTQAVTDKERAKQAMSYYCLSLTDIFWIRRPEQELWIDFTKINLYENHLNTAYMNVTLRGMQFKIESPQMLRENLGTGGCFPKAWIWKTEGLYLIKAGNERDVENELLASKICRCFDANQVLYEECNYDGQKMSACKIMTSLEYSIVPMEHYEIYLVNHEIKKMDAVLELDAYSYYMMNIMDYLLGNTDRHWGNWGVLVDNVTNQPVRLHDLMDFNRTFEAYDTLDGAPCLTTDKRQTQKEAAIEAVQKIGLNQNAQVREEWFEELAVKEMFFARLEMLRNVM